MANGTIMPSPWFEGFDDNGNPLNGGKLYTYEAGTTTPLATYSDVGLTTPNANPVVLDAAGRATIYLSAASYKFVLKTSADVTVRTADNISSVPLQAGDLDVSGTVGENVSGGDVVYLSNGSGGLTAGRWYKADADLTYASTGTVMIGMAPSAIASAASGAIRLSGRVTGLAGLTAGLPYYVSATPGALASTAPTARARFVGVAASTTVLVMAGNPPVACDDLSVCSGRLTLTSNTPVTITDVSAATSVFWTPYRGGQIALYTGTAWVLRDFTQLTISLAGFTASRPYDIFAYDNVGVVAVETLIWTSAVNRATGLVNTNGVLLKNGDATRRYLGTVFINSSGGQTDDTEAKRYLYNYTHRVTRALGRRDTTDSWTYSTDTWRQANAAAANQVEVMQGWEESPIAIRLHALGFNSTGNAKLSGAIGEDSTSAPVAGQTGIQGSTTALAANSLVHLMSELVKVPAVGLHTYVWLEKSDAVATTTWYGDNGGAAQSGLSGTWES